MAKLPPYCWFPTMTMTWNVSCWGVHRVFKPCSTVPGKASRTVKAYPRKRSGRRFANERENERPPQRKAAEPNAEDVTMDGKPRLPDNGTKIFARSWGERDGVGA